MMCGRDCESFRIDSSISKRTIRLPDERTEPRSLRDAFAALRPFQERPPDFGYGGHAPLPPEAKEILKI